MTSGTPRPVGFVLQMELKRRQLGLGHGAWATYLGIDRSLWYMLRHGQKELSMALIKRVLTLWRDEFDPFVSEAVLAWRDRDPDGQERIGEAC